MAQLYSNLVPLNLMLLNFISADFGARKRTRTSTPLREPGPEPGASANSAIRALRGACTLEIARVLRLFHSARRPNLCQRTGSFRLAARDARLLHPFVAVAIWRHGKQGLSPARKKEA